MILALTKNELFFCAPKPSLGKGLYAAKVTMGKLHKLYFEIPPTDLFQNPKILCHLYGQKDGMMRWHILISDIVSIHSMYCIKPNIT